MASRPIALLTDFGVKDHYVGSIKGVILRINPNAVIFDITHEVRPQQVNEAAFILNSVYRYVPKETVFVVVVDPGVGSKRKAVCIKTQNAFLIGPDNGVFTHVLSNEKKVEMRLITNDRYFVKPVSSTFHGRDIFAAVAGHLSCRDIFKSLGPKVAKLRQIHLLKAVHQKNGVRGQVVYIDRFGNAITNIRYDMLSHGPLSERLRITLRNNFRVEERPFFGVARSGELFALWNSNQYLELAVKNDSAEQKFKIKVGDLVCLNYGKDH